MKRLTLAILALAFVTVAGANAIVYSHNQTFNSVGNFNGLIGIVITPTQNVTIYNFTRDSGTAVGGGWVLALNSSLVNITTGSWSGTVAVVNSTSGVNLTAGTSYVIGVQATGASAFSEVNNSSMPVSCCSMTINTGFFWPSNRPSNRLFVVQTIGYDLILPSPPPILRINATDFYNGTSLTAFNATVQWNGTTINYSTTNGTIITTALVNSTLPANITFTPTQTNYFAISQTFTGYTNNTLQANATPWTLVRLRDAYNNTNLTTFTATYNGTTYNTSTGTVSVPILGSSTTLTLSATNYFSNVTTPAGTPFLQTLNATIVPWTLVRVFALNGTIINNFSVNYTNYANLSESVIVITTNGIAFVPLFNATYNVTVFNAGQGAINYSRESRNVIANPYDQAENFTLFLTNTVTFLVYNELNNIIINTTNNPNASTINIFLTGTIASYNYTTTNGSINASLILPDNYVVTFGGTGWTQRQTLFTLVNQSINQINLFLIPSNTAYTLETFFQNQNFQPVAGANVTLLKKNLSGTNYYTVYGCTADAGGRCVMSVDIPSTTYRISYSFGSFTGSSGDLQFTLNDVTTGRTFFINTVNNTLAPVFQWNTIGQTTAISFLRTNNTYNGVVRLTLNNPSLLATQACMNVYAVVGNTRSLVNSSCTPASSVVSLDVGALPSGADSLYAQAYVTIGGADFLIAQNSLQTNTGEISQAGRRLTLWAVVIGVALTMVLMFTWNPIAPPFIIGIVLYVFASVGLLYIPLGVVVSLIIMAFIMVLVIGKKT